MYNFLNQWIGLENLETPGLTYENRNISINIEEGGIRDGYYIYNSSSDFLYNEELNWAFHYFTFTKNRFDEIIFLRRFITPLGVLGYEELKYNLTDWYSDFFVAEYISEDGQSNHQIRMNLSTLEMNKYAPSNFILKQNFPNPFNPKTNIELISKKEQNGKISIYDLKGELINQIFNGRLRIGKNQFIWNGNNDMGNEVSSGIYIIKFESEDNKYQSYKINLLK